MCSQEQKSMCENLVYYLWQWILFLQWQPHFERVRVSHWFPLFPQGTDCLFHGLSLQGFLFLGALAIGEENKENETDQGHVNSAHPSQYSDGHMGKREYRLERELRAQCMPSKSHVQPGEPEPRVLVKDLTYSVSSAAGPWIFIPLPRS